jgi:phage recombination protein Bet
MADGSQTALVARSETPRASVLVTMAERYGMEAAAFEATLRGTVVPAGCTREQFAAFLLVAKEYRLNPITKEIYAFPVGGGGIQPIVSIDGWMNLINSHPQMNGLEFQDRFDDAGNLTAITARIWRKDRDKPIEVTEYMAECRRGTPTWKQWPGRMLRHKAAIQAARYAFGFSGIVDPDEAERIPSKLTPIDATPTPQAGGASTLAPPPVPLRRAGPPSPPPAPKSPPAPSAKPTASAPAAPPQALPGLLPKPADDPPVDAAAVLAHVRDELDACGDRETLDDAWSGMADLVDRLGRSDRERAADAYDKAAAALRADETFPGDRA